MSNLTVFIIICCPIILMLLALVLTVRGGHSCADALEECDAFKPLCASYNGDHQFFYSDCDLVRENCMTGSNWKLDHFSHCNVNN